MTEIVISDPTLDAADRALEKRENGGPVAPISACR